jgi:hypothetical protein
MNMLVGIFDIAGAIIQVNEKYLVESGVAFGSFSKCVAYVKSSGMWSVCESLVVH